MGIVLFFVSLQGKAQTSKYQFKIFDGSNGKRIEQAIITYEDTLGNFVKFTRIDSLLHQDEIPNKLLKLSINAFNYYTYTEIIQFPIQDTKVFFMKKDTAYQLSEVIVRSKNYNYLPDTLSFKVKDLRLSGDVKIEDVLNRFPGVKVDENGRITYRNKPIETVLLDGENLMESNYTLATKNIKVEEIEEIEAFDHFSENSIVAILGSSQLAALNLKFARKFSYTQSGNLDLGLVENQINGYNIHSTSIINSKHVKSFALISSNNLGDNHSSVNYTDYRDASLLYENLPAFPLNYGGAFPNAEKLKSNRNNQFSGNLNNIFKLHRKLTIKSFTNFLNDDFSYKQSIFTSNSLPENYIETSDEYDYQTKPQKWGQSVNLKYQPMPDFIFEGKYYLNDGRISFLTNQVINENVGFNSQQKSEINDYYLETIATQKVGQKSALQFTFQELYSQNNLKLNMNYLQPINRVVSQRLFYTYGENKILGKWIKVWIPKRIISESSIESLNMMVQLNNEGKKSSSFKEYRNSFHQEFTGNINGWVYSAKIENVQLEAFNNGLKENNTIWNSSYSVNTRLFKQNLGLNYSKVISSTYRNYFIQDTLFLDSRNQRIDSIQIGIPFQEKWNAIIFKNKLDRFTYQFSLTKILNHGGYYVNNNLSSFFNIQKNQWLNLTTTLEQVHAELGLYMKGIAVNFKLVGKHSVINFANYINASNLRLNKSISDELTLSAKSGYLKSFNFFEAFTVENTLFENQYNSFKNNIFKNTFQFNINTPRIASFLQIHSIQFYQGEPFLHFINAGIDVKSKKTHVSYNFSLNNLLDIRNRSFISINDYSRTVYKNYLVGRTLMLGIAFSL